MQKNQDQDVGLDKVPARMACMQGNVFVIDWHICTVSVIDREFFHSEPCGEVSETVQGTSQNEQWPVKYTGLVDLVSPVVLTNSRQFSDTEVSGQYRRVRFGISME